MEEAPIYQAYIVGTTIECIFVTVKCNSCKVNVCVFYRPPSSNVQYLDLYDSLHSLPLNNFILIGDFNIDFLSKSPSLPPLT